MPVEYLTEGRSGHMARKTVASFPSPQKHVEMQMKWKDMHNVTVSSHNLTHHKSQREYFDRPIYAPERGYAHIRKDKERFNAVYSKMTPMRSVGHAKQLMKAFRMIEAEEHDTKAPKWRGTNSPIPYAAQVKTPSHRDAKSGSELKPIVSRIMKSTERTISAPLVDEHEDGTVQIQE